MRKEIWRFTCAASISAAVGIIAACGGGGGGGDDSPGTTVTTAPGSTTTTTLPASGGLYNGKTTQATISAATVKESLLSVKDIVPSCTTTGITAKVLAKQGDGALLLRTAKLLMPTPTTKRTAKTAALVSSTKPADAVGTCGGTLTYPTYSHLSGTTTFSVSFANYCTTDSTTGNKTTINGSISAVDAGTPGASGPVTNKFTANIPTLTIVETTSTGAAVSSSSLKLTNFVYTPTAGATADISNLPGSFTLGGFEATATEGGVTKSYKLENVSITTSKVGTDTSMSMSARIYQSTSGYSDVTTGTTPLLIDADQNFKSGAITFTGASGSKATITALPGTGQNFSISVPNDTTLANARLTCSGL